MASNTSTYPQFPRGSTLTTREATQTRRRCTLTPNRRIVGEGGRAAPEAVGDGRGQIPTIIATVSPHPRLRDASCSEVVGVTGDLMIGVVPG